MFSTEDTIVAIATPPGRGGIGVVRLSGPRSHQVARAVLDRRDPLKPRHATLARVRGVDEVVVTWFAAPHSYTAEDVIEIAAHGSPVVLRAIVDAAVAGGARLAEPGEFTLRAFLNGRLDLVQCEAIADLIEAATPLQARTAFDQLEGTLTRRIAEAEAMLFDVVARLEASLDFPDEGYHFIDPAQLRASLQEGLSGLEALLADARLGRTVREGAHVVIAGRENVGKSSIFNLLAGHGRAIVTSVAGTTRDLVTEVVDVRGVAVTLVDTAGLRDTADPVEREGVARARQAAAVAALIVVVLDQSEALGDCDWGLLAGTVGRPRVIVRNKIDLAPAWHATAIGSASLGVSARSGANVDALRQAIACGLTRREDLRDTPAVSNARHIALIERAQAHLRAAVEASAAGAAVPEEFLLTDLQHARAALEEITGARTAEDLLQHIFERFCVGK